MRMAVVSENELGGDGFLIHHMPLYHQYYARVVSRSSEAVKDLGWELQIELDED